MDLDDGSIEKASMQLVYDSVQIYFIKEVDRNLSRPFIQPSFTTCDIGGGRGVDAIPFAHMSSSSFLLDTNREGLDAARDAANRLGLKSKMVFVECSALNLPFKNEVFDLVSSFSVLDHVPGENSHRSAIQEMARVTCSSGYVVVTLPNKLFFIGDMARKLMQTMGSVHMEKHFTPKELRNSMRFAGLEPLRFDAKYPTKIDDYIVSYHLPKFVKIVPNMILQPFMRVCEKAFCWLEKGCFKKCGARMGYIAQKRTQELS